MNKGQLVDALETRLGGKKAAAEALEAVVDTITTTVAKGEKVAITGFGTFEKAARAARTGRNPRTGQPVKIKKTAVPRFRAGTQFKLVTSDAKALKAFTSEVAARAKSAVGAAAGSVTKKAAGAPVAKATTKKAAAAPAKKAAAKKSTAKAATKKVAAAPAKKTVAKKSTAKAATKKVAAAPAKKAAVKKTTATKAAPAKKAAAKKSTAKKTARKA